MENGPVFTKQIFNTNYHINTIGEVTNFYSKKRLSEWKNKWGYSMISLSVNGKRKHYQIHRLIAILFIGKPVGDKRYACHNDGNKDNNTLSNIRWDTQKNNIADAIRSGHVTVCTGEFSKSSKLKDNEVWLIRLLLKNKIKQKTIAKMFKVSPQLICGINKGRDRSNLSTIYTLELH